VGVAAELMRLEVDDASMSEEDWLSVGLSAIVCLVCLVVVPFRIKEEQASVGAWGKSWWKFLDQFQRSDKSNAVVWFPG
jgi:hypothetical protein